MKMILLIGKSESVASDRAAPSIRAPEISQVASVEAQSTSTGRGICGQQDSQTVFEATSCSTCGFECCDPTEFGDHKTLFITRPDVTEKLRQFNNPTTLKGCIMCGKNVSATRKRICINESYVFQRAIHIQHPQMNSSSETPLWETTTGIQHHNDPQKIVVSECALYQAVCDYDLCTWCSLNGESYHKSRYGMPWL